MSECSLRCHQQNRPLVFKYSDLLLNFFLVPLDAFCHVEPGLCARFLEVRSSIIDNKFKKKIHLNPRDGFQTLLFTH